MNKKKKRVKVKEFIGSVSKFDGEKVGLDFKEKKVPSFIKTIDFSLLKLINIDLLTGKKVVIKVESRGNKPFSIKWENKEKKEGKKIKEKLEGCVEEIIDEIAYLDFETPKGPLERAMELPLLEFIGADHEGALIRIEIESRDGSAVSMKWINIERKGERTWRDELEEDPEYQKFLERIDHLKDFAEKPKPSKIQ